VFADVEFTLTQTPKGFRPEDARDDPATSKCSGTPGDNCRPSFTVRLKETSNGPWWPADLHVTYDFVLDHPSVLAGLPVTAWLKGSSTNSDGPLETPDHANYPDYVFEAQGDAQLGAPDRNGLHVATANDIDYSNASGNAPGGEDQTIDVTVTSRDYGGSAILRPTVTISGAGLVKPEKAKFNIVDDQGNDVVAPDPGCVAADEFVQHPYASLPVDQDCNGIADSWEADKGGPYPDPRADVEPGGTGGGTPDAYQGDGLAVFDEYRGFHMLDAWGNVVWHDTDPRVQDLFYWDPYGLIQQSPLDPNPNRLANVFGVQTGGFIALHEVNAEQAHGDQNDPTTPLEVLNSNSPFLASFGPRAFAVVYVKDNLNQRQDNGTLGQSCNPGTSGTVPAYADCYRNNGRQPIHIDSDRIHRLATKFWKGDPTAYESVLVDEVLAHETGHKLGLWHHTRTAAKATLDKGQLKDLPGNLPFGSFIQSKNRSQVTIEEYLYMLLKANGFKRDTQRIDEVPRCAGYGNAGATFDVRQQAPFPGKVQLPHWPIEGIGVEGTGVSLPPDLSLITLDSQDGEIMSSKPQLDHTADGDWQFGGDLGGMCLQPNGCGKALPSVNCGE
jgi:hypothetical protein